MDFFASLPDGIDPEMIRRTLLLFVLSLVRFSAFFAIYPVFGRVIPTGLLRTGIIFGLATLVYPHLSVQLDLQPDISMYKIGMLILKEAFLGLCLGMVFAFVAWGVEAAGNLIDFNRGAFVAAMFSPLTQVNTTPLGTFFAMLYAAFLFTSGAFLYILGLIYDSYNFWPVLSFYPSINAELPLLMLGGMDKMMTVMLLVSGPIIILNFVAELALSIYTRYAQQLNVFIFALPIKSGIALVLLVFMMPFLFEVFERDLFYLGNIFFQLRDILDG